MINIQQIRQDFPILQQTMHGKPLVYLDSAASAQKPQIVIDGIKNFYEQNYANVHRGIYSLSEKATRAFEDVRLKTKNFIHAKEEREIVFTRGTTEAINLVAQCYGREQLKPGDEVLISTMEHHANIVPWQIVCQQTGAILRVIPINDAGEIIVEEYQRLLNARTKIVALTHVSNTLGTINPIAEMIQQAHAVGAIVLIDGAQATPHLMIDVQKLDCDFYAFSSHKLFGPSGVGVLYGKAKLLEAMPPYQSGGDMISMVSFAKTTYREIPYKFEAGTPNITGVVAFGIALDYLNNLDRLALHKHEESLLHYATECLQNIPQLKIIGTAKNKAAIISFVFDDVHAHDVGTILDYEGIAVRTGHHCTMPLMERFNVPATSRASFAFYNTREEVDALILALHKVREVFK